MKNQNTQKTMGSRTLINIIGIFIFLGTAIAPITQSYSFNKNFELIRESSMDTEQTKEFYLFIVIISILFFFLANIYFLGKTGKRIFYTVLSIIFLSCCYLAIVLY